MVRDPLSGAPRAAANGPNVRTGHEEENRALREGCGAGARHAATKFTTWRAFGRIPEGGRRVTGVRESLEQAREDIGDAPCPQSERIIYRMDGAVGKQKVLILFTSF